MMARDIIDININEVIDETLEILRENKYGATDLQSFSAFMYSVEKRTKPLHDMVMCAIRNILNLSVCTTSDYIKMENKKYNIVIRNPFRTHSTVDLIKYVCIILMEVSKHKELNIDISFDNIKAYNLESYIDNYNTEINTKGWSTDNVLYNKFKQLED